jgi:hypothetical protein
MTHDEIGKALGLLPSELQRCVGVARNVERMKGCADLWDPAVKRSALTRQTGRTTEMLVHALVHASHGELVRLSAHNRAWEAKLVKQARQWATKLKLDTNLIQGSHGANPQGRYDGQVFVDHYLGPAGMGRWPAVSNG